MSRLTFSIILLAAALGLGYWLVLPKYMDISSLQEELMLKKQESDGRFDYIRRLENLSIEIEEHTEEVVRLERALPRKSNTAEVLAFLEQKASANSILIKEISIASKQNRSTLSAIGKTALQEESISIEITGMIDSLVNFLTDIENSARLLRVESVEFSLPFSRLAASSFSYDKNNLSFYIVLKTYYWDSHMAQELLAVNLEPREVDINFDVLNLPLLDELSIFEEIQDLDNTGRNNPFTPY